MSAKSGWIDIKEGNPKITQRGWRAIGAVSVGIAGIMAWYGSRSLSADQSPLMMLIYWGVFLLFLIVAMYMVILDVRFIRLQYTLGKREVYRGTLGDEEFRRNLIDKLENNDPKAHKNEENSV